MNSKPKESTNPLKAIESVCNLDHLLTMNINTNPHSIRLTGIVCTIGPATREVPKMVELIKAGMVIARMNFSHGTYEYHKGSIENVRKAVHIVSKDMNVHNYAVAIALDTKGPEIRTGLLTGGSTAEVELIKGKTIKVTTDQSYDTKGSNEIIFVDYKNITKVLVKESRIFVDDGLISLVVKEVGPDFLNCQIENGGKLGSKKGVNLPGAVVDLPAVSEKDKLDIKFGVENGVDMVFASFIRNGAGVKEIRNILKANGGNDIKIISKVENHEGVIKINEIIAESDGVMVARGDLGIEIPAKKVFLAQKMMIAKCNIVGKPVICATQMLESMTTKPRPTRAEVSDVANAILDGADCVMLSGETAKGEYPSVTVAMMHDIALEAENAVFTGSVFDELCWKTHSPTDVTTSIAMAAVMASIKSISTAIVVLTNSGRTAYLVSKYRPRCPIIAVTNNALITRQARLYRGILPFLYDQPIKETDDWLKSVDDRIRVGIDFGKKIGCVKVGDSVVVVSGQAKESGATNTMRIIAVQ